MHLFNTGAIGIYIAREGHALEWSSRAIEEEPMLFQASVGFARAHGGPLTQALLRDIEHVACTQYLERMRIDTRSHMLMPGWYPCIPGWHCDFMHATSEGVQIPRKSRDAQVQHYMFVSSGPCTEFAKARDVPYSLSEFRWKNVDAALNDKLEGFPIPEQKIVAFDANELHRGTPHRGQPGHWRFFFPRNRLRSRGAHLLPSPSHRVSGSVTKSTGAGTLVTHPSSSTTKCGSSLRASAECSKRLLEGSAVSNRRFVIDQCGWIDVEPEGSLDVWSSRGDLSKDEAFKLAYAILRTCEHPEEKRISLRPGFERCAKCGAERVARDSDRPWEHLGGEDG